MSIVIANYNDLVAQELIGTANSDLLIGGPLGDTITGGEGADLLLGRGGDDTVHAGAGADMVLGGDGSDVIFGDEEDAGKAA